MATHLCGGSIRGDAYLRRLDAWLPLSAFIPGRRVRGSDRNDYLSRPRFLAISEFGPRAVIYYEGVRYRVVRVILPASDMDEEGLATVTAILDRFLHHPDVISITGRSYRLRQKAGGADALKGNDPKRHVKAACREAAK